MIFRLPRPLTLVLLALTIAASSAWAKPLSFPKHHFSIDVPAGWEAIDQHPPDSVAAIASSDRSKLLIITAFKYPDATASEAVAAAGRGLNKSMTAQGWQLDKESAVTIKGRTFTFVSGVHGPTGLTTSGYITATPEEVYMLVFMDMKAAARADDEISSIVQSLRFHSAEPAK